jgi:hypothetical protein
MKLLLLLLMIIDLSISSSNMSPITNKQRIVNVARNVYITSLVGITSAYISQSINDDNRY